MARYSIAAVKPHLLPYRQIHCVSKVQAMAVAAPSPRPNRHDITAETTGLDLVTLPAGGGQPSEVVLHLAVTETHQWFGIGGASERLRRPRLLTRHKRLPLASSGPDCRRLIVRELMHEFHGEGFRRLSAADWDAAVPRGVEACVADRARALPAGRACRCEVSIRVGVEFVYSEPAALLRACTDAGGLMASRAADGDGDGAAPPCPICLEEMARDAGATCLPGCGHGFHRRCIGRWFQEASTCPVCRRDKLQYLPPGYMAVHDMMLSDPEGSC